MLFAQVYVCVLKNAAAAGSPHGSDATNCVEETGSLGRFTNTFFSVPVITGIYIFLHFSACRRKEKNIKIIFKNDPERWITWLVDR